MAQPRLGSRLLNPQFYYRVVRATGRPRVLLALRRVERRPWQRRYIPVDMAPLWGPPEQVAQAMIERLADEYDRDFFPARERSLV